MQKTSELNLKKEIPPKEKYIPYGEDKEYKKPIQINTDKLGEIPSHMHIAPMLRDSFWQWLDINSNSKAIQSMIEGYEKRMHLILRWSNNLEKTDQLESDLQHVGAMLQMINEIENKFPAFAEALDLNLLRLLIIIHDIGEGGQGDLPATALTGENDKKKREQHKQTELHYGRRLLQQGIQDEVTLRDFIVNLFYAYEFRNNPELLESYSKNKQKRIKDIIEKYPNELHFMKVLDILQAFFWGEKNFFHNISEDPNISKKILQPAVFKKAFDSLWQSFSKEKSEIAQYQLLDMAEVFLSFMSQYNNVHEVQANLAHKRYELQQKDANSNEFDLKRKKKTDKLKKKQNISALKDLIKNKISELQNADKDTSRLYQEIHSLLNTGKKFLQQFSEDEQHKQKLLEFNFFIEGQRTILQRFYCSEIMDTATIKGSDREYEEFLQKK